MAHIKLIMVLALCLGVSVDASALQAQWNELNQKANRLYEQGKYAEATRIAERALEVATRTFGPDHLNVAASLNNLAVLYDDQGKYADAEPLYKRSLAIREKTLGPDHPDVAESLNNLAGLYQSQGKYADAEPLYKRSLAIREKALGRDHPDVATALNNLASLHWYEGKYADAEPLIRRGLAIREKALGKDHPDVAESLNSLAVLYDEQGKYVDAEPLFRRSLAINEKALGKDHPNVAHALNSLASLHLDQGKYADAEPLYKRSLAIREKALGKDHPDVAKSLNNLAVLYQLQGKYADAEPLYKGNLAIFEKRLGNDHPDVAKALANLAGLYQLQGKYADAEPLYKRSLVKLEKGLGNDHPDVAKALANLAGLYQLQGKYADVEPLYKRSLVKLEKALGPDHPTVAIYLDNLALIYKAQGKYADAEPLHKRSLAILEKALGPDHPAVANSLSNLGVLYQDKGDYVAALCMYQESLEIQKKKGLPLDGLQNLIANLYLDRGEVTKAEPIITEAGRDLTRARLCLMKKDFQGAKDYYDRVLIRAEENRDADSLFTAYTGLGRVYEAQEDYGKAEEYYEKGMQFTEEIRSGLLPAERKDFFNVRVNGFSRSDPGKGLTRVMMKLNQASGSIDSSEVTRARAFADNLFERSATSGSSLPQKVLDREDELLNRVATLKKELGKTDREKQSERYETLFKAVKNAESDLKTFVEKLRKDYPGYAAVKYPRPVTLGESALHPDEFVVMFDVSNEGVGVKLIHGKKIAETYYKDWPLPDLENDVKRFREPFETKKLKAFDPDLGHALYRKLMARVMMDVPKGKPIVIIPDGILAVLPFEALVTGGTASWKKSTQGEYPEGVTYLEDEHPISYYQSITALTLARTMGNKNRPGDKLLVVADPVFQMRDDRAQSVRQERVAGTEGEFYVNVMKAIEDDSGVRFANLPETGLMADKLGEMFKPNSLVLTGLKANKADFIKDVAPRLDTYGRIVFATHGVFSTRIPGLKEPFLALTMVPPGTDGFLRMSDILSLKMNADIVALTACQTGLGKELSGEGVMSMGRAFQYAGAKSVLMSLWEVQVDSALLLMETFFQNLKAGQSKLDALTAARERVRGEGYKHPFYWAPFILVGEAN